jgi:hypothetical protein
MHAVGGVGIVRCKIRSVSFEKYDLGGLRERDRSVRSRFAVGVLGADSLGFGRPRPRQQS